MEQSFKPGTMVKVKDTPEDPHCDGIKGQIGVVYKCNGILQDDWYYSIVSKDVRTNRLWGHGVFGKDLEPLGIQFEDLIDCYTNWLSDGCWKNTDHTEFRKFTKWLKYVRTKYKAIVNERML